MGLLILGIDFRLFDCKEVIYNIRSHREKKLCEDQSMIYIFFFFLVVISKDVVQALLHHFFSPWPWQKHCRCVSHQNQNQNHGFFLSGIASVTLYSPHSVCYFLQTALLPTYIINIYSGNTESNTRTHREGA